MHIYAISDEPILIVILETFLADLGHEVVSASSPDEFLDKLARSAQPVDLIMTDLHRSPEEGIALIRTVHQRSPDTPIVVVTDYDPTTGYNPTLSPDEALAYGVYAYLRKPIHLGELEVLLVRLSESRVKSRR